MFCLRPFTQYYVYENGDVHLCCHGWVNRTAGNVLRDDPVDIWKGTAARDIRDSILDGSFRYCTGCAFLPGPAGHVEDSPPRRPPLDVIDNLVAAYDPTCNLTCPSCRACAKRPSTAASVIQKTILTSGILSMVRKLSASEVGDPFASSLFWELLGELPRQNCPELKLILKTNGLLLDERCWDRMGGAAERIQHVEVSVDGATPETYAKNRGGDFEVLRTNLGGIRDREVCLLLNFVVQANNFDEMRDFMRMADEYGASQVTFSGLVQWGTYAENDYAARAVHVPSHPRHAELVRALEDPVFRDGRRSVNLLRMPRA